MARKQKSILHFHNVLASSSNKITSFIKFMLMKITKFMLVQSKSYSTDEKHKVFCRWSFYHRRSSSPVPPMSSSATSSPSESPPEVELLIFPLLFAGFKAQKFESIHAISLKHERHSVSTTSINPPMFCSYIIRRSCSY